MRVYPQHKVLRADAYTVILAWIALPLAFLTLLLGNYLPSPIGGPAFFSLFAAFFALALIHLALSLLHRCPTCKKHPTIQGFKPIHPAAKSEKGLDGWSRVVWNIFRNRPFRCIHCGDEFVARDEP
jgi:hypothetical protein